MDAFTPNLRRTAFERLAFLDTLDSQDKPSKLSVSRLIKECRAPSSKSVAFGDGFAQAQSKAPMTLRELEIILALTKAAPNVTCHDQVLGLASQFSGYLTESYNQQFRASPFLHEIKPSPWEALTHDLTKALLDLSLNDASVRDQATTAVVAYLDNCARAVKGIIKNGNKQNGSEGPVEPVEILITALSLAGFLEGASHSTQLWVAAEKSAIIERLQTILSDDFLVAVETAASKIRNSSATDFTIRDWRRYNRRYAAKRRPLGAMLLQQRFSRFIKSCTVTTILRRAPPSDAAFFEKYADELVAAEPFTESEEAALVKYIVGIITDGIHLLEDGADYLQIGSQWQQELAFSVKASSLIAFLNCMSANEELADTDLLLSWLEDTLADANQMAAFDLATTALEAIAVTAKLFPSNASNLSHLLLKFIIQGGASQPILSVAASCLAKVLKILSQDFVITTLYSLGNVLSPTVGGVERPVQLPAETPENNPTLDAYNSNTESVVSLSYTSEEDSTVTHRNVIHAIATIAVSCEDEKIAALAQSMLLQKIGRISLVADAYIVQETASLALVSKHSEFQLLLKFYARLHREALLRGHNIIADAVHNARNNLSIILRESPSHRGIYLVHLLEGIISKGDMTDLGRDRPKDITLSPDDITPFLKPLALLLSDKNGGEVKPTETYQYDEDTAALFRDAWFNIAVHGISVQSDVGRRYRNELSIIAEKSPPLVPENRTEILESDVELNITLRRGMGHQRLAEQRKLLASELPDHESNIKRINYQEIVFLNASLLIESLRASAGDCTKILLYFLDPSLSSSELGKCMEAVADKVLDIYLSNALSGKGEYSASPHLSRQLAEIFVYCCHRINRVQEIALNCASKIISRSPSVLCDRNPLFILLDLLTIIWSSCLENELDEYGWKSTLTKGNVTVELSDNHESRKRTLGLFHSRAKAWMIVAINLAPLDVKGLLQTYLSDYDDDGAYGHISLGRSFALDMASQVPQSDQRLGYIENYGVENVNCASDLIAQYTSRQEYRYSEFSQNSDRRKEIGHLSTNGTIDPYLNQYIDLIENLLKQLALRISTGYDLSSHELHDALRKAAALLCRSDGDLPSIAHYLVDIPFQIFSKESIKFGISIWLGVINENPKTEARILTEVAAAWEQTVQRRKGLFDPEFNHPDPFFTTIELLPSDKTALLRQQHLAQDVLSPHLRILQFFESHFNATRIASPNLQRIFSRMISRTLAGLQHTNGHPLSREVHFHIILLGLRIIQHSTTQSRAYKWKLKDLLLSAALSWFRHPPRWSFGGNRLQMKAEDKLLKDVEDALKHTASICSSAVGYRQSLRNKQELLQILIENERTRLKVWLFPLEQERKHYISGLGAKHQSEAIDQLLRTAWGESASLAIQMCSRFPSQKIHNDVRWLLLNFPEKAIDVPESLEMMFGSSLPSDVSFQLKYLLYWSPVAPSEALTYFLPAYGNHPFVLQYAMRALESHSIDVRFYFVPQLVQALRYDALGYVERYIFESAKLSQLFAHQVIWNMKANAYKDEDSEIPDLIKPTLDKFMDKLVSSFSDDERNFYEREFSFFNEITGVSGKLRPYIKKSKSEKKEKIEEELRKIKVEVGVYLPSNPDGIVVGIDRKSGKPLQSHAKAPYMATFRIQKTKAIEGAPKTKDPPENEKEHKEHNQETYEVWQSAIFKVGDDCRQDVLALQLIAAFRNVFNSVGLDVWVFPYRVTATAPGCGVIDVLPNSISRDMLGREAVNGLYDYFVSKYGGEESTRFQEARTNFVKSMASYSVISYLLQFKDRHNGNIMIDDAGHIIHIDFGFCFDIAPGGVRFERAPFKLTSEMVAVMGGGPHLTGSNANGISNGAVSSNAGGSGSTSSSINAPTLRIPGTHSHDPMSTQPFQWFESLAVKAFLASRPHATKFIQIVTMMIDSGLPCFKPDTLKNFRDRFVLDKTEREAADYMRELTRKSYLSFSTKGYDQFQLMTNGIPY
ncbi:hypothetical protein UA08_03926 [Talaromyces atroroseus]|uniref:1-phosphatidylinositol 4-kinase n=1 Tax=Talaromyces atroroseus TaxID=1441469 RepID=A0A225AIJ2_TALAT|nr:hypothetical protein UA08_03926 [Talaromyces atroroseus]OKL61261.1 hypothetical protein UA08_03926 [Talaromyces atroroseus]